MAEITGTISNFNSEVINSDIPVLVDFWASWCGPCMMLAPQVETLAKEYEGRLKVVKVNVDDEQKLAMQFGVMSIPTLIVFDKGQAVQQSVGLIPYQQLEALVKPYIG